MRHRRVLLGLSMDVFVALGWGTAERYKDPTVRWRELRYQVGGYQAARLEQRRRLAERHGWAGLGWADASLIDFLSRTEPSGRG